MTGGGRRAEQIPVRNLASFELLYGSGFAGEVKLVALPRSRRWAAMLRS
ncbi:MAG: hypothetical protein H6914_00305 [Novosphingobium sp.]|nr:hypothetical protein [Novosphingobium sp.]